jgi:hypothetical protein
MMHPKRRRGGTRSDGDEDGINDDNVDKGTRVADTPDEISYRVIKTASSPRPRVKHQAKKGIEYEEFMKLDSFDLVELLQAFEKYKEAALKQEPQSTSTATCLQVFQKLKFYSQTLHFSYQQLWTLLQSRIYNTQYDADCCVVGAGPAGLRTAIELALMGFRKVTVYEKRQKLSRNNVLHMWPFTVWDLKCLGAKVLFKSFAVGGIDHVSIKRVQLILLKISLLLGVEVILKEFDEDTDAEVVVVADGEDSSVAKKLGIEYEYVQFSQAIGVTANFQKIETGLRTSMSGGQSSYFAQGKFKQLASECGVILENLVYYVDDTHYLVMTVKKEGLLEQGVLKSDKPDYQALLERENVSTERLLELVRKIATVEGIPPEAPFETNGKTEDIAIFDFSRKATAKCGLKAIKNKNGYKQLVFVVGDALIAPFWPVGTGLAHAGLSALDAAHIVAKMGTDLMQWDRNYDQCVQEMQQLNHFLEISTSDSIKVPPPGKPYEDIKQTPIDPKERYKINI